MFQIRTDLAMETSEDCQKAKKDMRGLSEEQKRLGDDILLPMVKLAAEKAAKQWGVPTATEFPLSSVTQTK